MESKKVNENEKQKFIPLSSNLKFIDYSVNLINKICPLKKCPVLKNSNYSYFMGILDVFERLTYWTDFIGTIKWKTLHSRYRIWSKLGFFEMIHKYALEKYLKKNKSGKLKIQSIDASAIINKQGVELIGFGKKGGGKRITNVSLLSDTYGAPLAIHQFKGSRHDSTTIPETLNKLPIGLNTLIASANNKHKQYLLADSGYCSIKNRKFLGTKGYTPLIWFNKRRTIDKKKLKKMKLNERELKKYKKRMIVESAFAWLKNFPKLNCLYEKTSLGFTSLLLLGASYVLINKT